MLRIDIDSKQSFFVLFTQQKGQKKETGCPFGGNKIKP
jgi:hypothetical protein